ncbi:Amidohydrolase 3 [Aminomonas paucivorans DSM 12260]|uniref:Amidohydrolase 3 n=1 Tax=Aminomonas paucivorans DSM 12260 TaxID=584708 RepID=E3CW33_9BACT|nr:amidohydrolase [Aminomonas paucivorans]EFQ24288.1 Amidohydrolase 3 [Aminomonas paucivorans DSM 12260]
MERSGPTLALINGTVYPFAAPGKASGVFSRDGVLEVVGDDRDVLERCDARTVVLDLRGRYVFPGFQDTHLHLLEYGRSLVSPDLRDVTSIEGMVQRGRDALARSAGARELWHFGRGWDQNRLAEERFPSRQDLDRISDTRPILYERVCGHVGVLNSPALERLGVRGDLHVHGGVVDLDDRGEPTGVVREGALNWVQAHLPPPEEEQLREWLRLGAEGLARGGVSTVQTDDFSLVGDLERLTDFYFEEDAAGRLPLRVDLQLLLSGHRDLEALSRILARAKAHQGRLCRLGPVKLVLDGTLGARTAALREDYADGPGRGLLAFETRELVDLVGRIEAAGCQVACHAIGDAALEQALEAFETTGAGTRCGHPPRILHCQVGDEELYDRMVRLGVAADVQPAFVASDWPMILDRLGADRARTGYAWKSLLDRGVVLAGESDAPAETPGPLEGIRAAVTRKDLAGQPDYGWMPQQRLEVPEAFWLYTGGAAHVCGQGRRRGTLEPGKAADLVVLMEDPFRVEGEEIGAIPVGLTICGGVLRHLV